MNFIPVRKSRTAAVVAFSLILMGIVIYAVGGFVNYRSLLRIVAVVCLIGGIEITQKFLLTEYEYIINAFEDIYRENNIVVMRKQGKRVRTECNLTLNLAKDIVPNEKTSVLTEKFGKIDYRYNFCIDMFPKNEAYALILKFNGKQALVRLQCGKEFAEEIKKRIPQSE